MRFYVDSSVWGGYFDKEFEDDTVPFIEQVRKGKYIAVISNVTADELLDAPENVRNLVAEIPASNLEITRMTLEQKQLGLHYIEKGALTKKCENDAFHIAISTILKVDSLVSWNFKHMVNFFRIKQYNDINKLFGYEPIDIRTPKEIIYEKE